MLARGAPQFKGTAHSKLNFRPFSTHHYVSSDISGVSQQEKNPPNTIVLFHCIPLYCLY